MVIYERSRGFELGTTANKSSKWRERASGTPDCESNELVTRPRYRLCLQYVCFIRRLTSEIALFILSKHRTIIQLKLANWEA